MALWSKKDPYHAILVGFIIYVVALGLNYISDPHRASNGAFGQLLLIVALFYGYKGGRDFRKIETELNTIKKAKDLNIDHENL